MHRTSQKIYHSWEHTFLDWHRQTYKVLPTPATKMGLPLQLQCGLNTSGNDTGLLRLVSTQVHFPAWMDLPPTALTHGWGHRCQWAQMDQTG